MSTLSPHQYAQLGLQRTREAEARVRAARQRKTDSRAFWEVVRDWLWAAGEVDLRVLFHHEGVVIVLSEERAGTGRGDLETEQARLARAEALLRLRGLHTGRRHTSTGRDALWVCRIRAQQDLFG